MIRKILMSGAILLLSAVLPHGLAQSAIERRPWEDYEVLIERNIFSRQRGRRAVEAARPPAPPSPPAQRFVWLRGISRRGDRFTAFLEDTRSGETIVAREGTLVAEGTVTKVELDGIRYRLEDKEFGVAVGENLEASDAPVPAGASAGSTPPSAPAEPGEVDDILERLRRRRMEEIGQ